MEPYPENIGIGIRAIIRVIGLAGNDGIFIDKIKIGVIKLVVPERRKMQHNIHGIEIIYLIQADDILIGWAAGVNPGIIELAYDVEVGIHLVFIPKDVVSVIGNCYYRKRIAYATRESRVLRQIKISPRWDVAC